MLDISEQSLEIIWRVPSLDRLCDFWISSNHKGQLRVTIATCLVIIFYVVENAQTLEDLRPRFWVVRRPVSQDVEKIPSKWISCSRFFWTVVNVAEAV
jgi:hypothetical protein